MSRKPFNVLVIPFVPQPDGTVLYCILRRADEGWWQWVAGGGEDDESPADAALRETLEETALAGPLFQLSSQARVPVVAFSDRASWPLDLYVIPEHHFALKAASMDAKLSREHTELLWATYQDAHRLLRWDSNRTALWELAERLRKNDLRPMGELA